MADLFLNGTRPTDMKLMACGVFFAIVAAVGPAAAQDVERVRAATPTTVTVQGQQDAVDPFHTARKQGLGAKIVSGVKGAVGKTWNGIVHVGGWLLDENDDIPSERDRRASTAAEPR